MRKQLLRQWMDVAGNEYYEFDNNEIEVIKAKKLDISEVEISLEG